MNPKSAVRRAHLPNHANFSEGICLPKKAAGFWPLKENTPVRCLTWNKLEPPRGASAGLANGSVRSHPRGHFVRIVRSSIVVSFYSAIGSDAKVTEGF